MKTKALVLNGLLLSIGFVVHQVTPGIVGGIKFDFLLSMLFIALLINRDFKICMATGVVAGIITALTTSFPGGQLPNIIDKLVTTLVIYALIGLLAKLSKQVVAPVIGFVGTIISGTVFLVSVALIVGLPASFTALFMSVVLPTAVTNTFLVAVVYNITRVTLKKTGAVIQE